VQAGSCPQQATTAFATRVWQAVVARSGGTTRETEAGVARNISYSFKGAIVEAVTESGSNLALAKRLTGTNLFKTPKYTPRPDFLIMILNNLVFPKVQYVELEETINSHRPTLMLCLKLT
jgi:hypothetical protein